ncbi:acyltransferase family protein [Pseudarthrobacter sp. SSS035]|uniref:acyltransferase family protein n=1 Tax=Pseudarthrobacter sp. SSS035 TaxID=2931399 RepID=UPI00201035C4|nr:acyltransferase family protein [Pseudarthrobacter sp. SSS035]
MSGIASVVFPTQTTQAAPPSKKATAKGRRLDIEGLRAIAVGVVIMDHLIHWPTGGFIGVDIFFVISGYLISGILIREVQSKGKVDFRGFYIRRAKRILPAAAVVLSMTVTASYVLFYSGQAAAIAADAFWALLFSANWRFALLGTDYMQAGASVSPLQHFWSLAVEEQFYVFWPWVLMAALGLALRLGMNARGKRLLLLAAIVLVAVLSFAFGMYETASHPTVAYFSTFARAWELAVGAALAAGAAYFRNLTQWLRAVLLYAGLAGIGISLFVIGPGTPFPAPYATLPVVSTMLILVAGEQAPDRHNRTAWVLTNPVSQYLGKISYSLYLWHFPVIVLLGVILPAGSKRHLLLSIVIFCVLAALSFKYVEDPLRRIKLSKAVSSPTRWGDFRQPQGRRNSLLVLALLSCFVIVPPAVAFAVLSPAKTLSNAASASGGDRDESVDDRHESLQTALRADAWPELRPNAAEMGPDGANAKPSEWIKDGCLGGTIVPQRRLDDVIENAKSCVYGNAMAKNSMVIYGDSTTMSFVPGIRAALQREDWVVYVYTVGGCTPTIVNTAGVDGSTEECKRFKNWVQDEISSKTPTMVVSSFLRNDAQLANKKTGTEADAEWHREVADTANFMVHHTSKYVMLEAPPSARVEPSQCITRFSKPSDCITTLSADYSRQTEVLRSATASAGEKALFVPISGLFCVEGKCPAFIGSVGTYADVNHISEPASTHLAPFLRLFLRLD